MTNLERKLPRLAHALEQYDSAQLKPTERAVLAEMLPSSEGRGSPEDLPTGDQVRRLAERYLEIANAASHMKNLLSDIGFELPRR